MSHPIRPAARLLPLYSLALLIAAGAIATGAIAATLHVPADLPTIQSALDSAGPGDVVQVAAGTYYENILWPEVDGIRLIGAGPAETIVDGSRVASVIRFEAANVITAATRIEGLTIRNGFAQPPWPSSHGGGIYLLYADPVLMDLWIVENEADDFGGGIYSWWSDPTLIRVVIARNTAISRGGFNCFHGTPHFDHVTVADNDPGGIYFDTRTVPLLENSVIAFNGDYGIELQGTYIEQTEIDLAYTDIIGGVLLVGVVEVHDLGGNIVEDPRFVDWESGDYGLLEDSPCIDAADPEYPLDPDGTRSDMGAFSFTQGTSGVEGSEGDAGVTLSLAAGPNPFVSSTTISYVLQETAPVTVRVFDSAGRAVQTLVDRTLQGPGLLTVGWDGKDAAGRAVPSGIYLYRVEAPGVAEARSVVLIGGGR